MKGTWPTSILPIENIGTLVTSINSNLCKQLTKPMTNQLLRVSVSI